MKKLLSLILVLVLALSAAGCGAEPAEEEKPVDLQAVYDGLALPEMLVLDANTVMNMMGIRADACKQMIVAVCADGLRTDEIWLLEAADDESFRELSELAENRIQIKANETRDYTPDQYAVVELAEVLQNGRYLALLVSPDVADFKTAWETAFN